MSAPGIDVIVPCYNYGRYLPDCVSSVLDETQIPVRVLIIDDASPDGSVEVAHRLAAADPRVTVLAHAVNRGHIATYNEGIDWLEQRYMLLLSADDMVAPGALARAVRLMEDRPAVAFVHGRAMRFSSEDELAAAETLIGPCADATVGSGLAFIQDRCAVPLNPVQTATAVVRTEVQKRVGGYCAQLPHAGDLEMWLRCAAQGDVGEIPALQAFVRIHDANMHHGYTGAQILADHKQRREAFGYFFDHHRATLPGAAELEQTALRALAMDLLWEASRVIESGGSDREIINYARELWPGVTRTSRYLKLGVKRGLRPLVPQWRSGARSSEVAA